MQGFHQVFPKFFLLEFFRSFFSEIPPRSSMEFLQVLHWVFLTRNASDIPRIILPKNSIGIPFGFCQECLRNTSNNPFKQYTGYSLKGYSRNSYYSQLIEFSNNSSQKFYFSVFTESFRYFVKDSSKNCTLILSKICLAITSKILPDFLRETFKNVSDNFIKFFFQVFHWKLLTEFFLDIFQK